MLTLYRGILLKYQYADIADIANMLACDQDVHALAHLQYLDFRSSWHIIIIV